MRSCSEAEEERDVTSSVLIDSSTTIVLPTMHATKGRFWAWWPWPLTYDLELRTWPRYLQPWPACQNSSLYVCSFGQDSETDGGTHRHTDRQTDIRTQATCHPHGRVFLMCYSQPYEGNFCTTNFSYVWKILVNLTPKNNCNSVTHSNTCEPINQPCEPPKQKIISVPWIFQKT